MKAVKTVKPLFFTIAFLFLATSALKLSDVVQLRKKLHKMESDAGSLPLGRKLAEVHPVVPKTKDAGVASIDKQSVPSSRKQKNASPPKEVKPVELPPQPKPDRRLGFHAGHVKSKINSNKARRAVKKFRKAKKSAKSSKKKSKRRAILKSKGRGLTDKSPATLVPVKKASQYRSVKTKPSGIQKAPSKVLPVSRFLKIVPNHKKSKVKKVSRNKKTAKKKRAVKVKKAKKSKLAAKKSKRKAATVAKPKNSKETLALAAMNSATATPAAAKPAPTVTERKLLDLPSQNEFYEQIVNNYYPTI